METSSPITPKPVTTQVSRLLLWCLLVGVGIFVGRYLLPVNQGDSTTPMQLIGIHEGKREITFPTFWEAWDELHAKFIDSGQLTDDELFYGAVEGMVRATGDPYTVFAAPEETKRFEETIEGSFSGVGIEIGLQSGLITVIAPLEGSPAQKAGVREGDIIAAIDKEPLTQEATLDEVVTRIRGPRGSKVVLTVIHKNSRETSDVEITRDRIEIESAKLKMEGDIAIINITSFNSDTSQRFTTLLREALAANARGVVIDVRNNPGGFLQSSVEIASRFVPKGAVVVSERGKTTTEFKAEGNQLLNNVPVVVLVNGGSASASEILAGALHDHLQVPLVGTKTFGKGSVQEFIKLDDGSSMRVTVAKWFTPNGRNINEEGIEPTVAVEQNNDTPEDEQLQKALEELRSRLK